MPFTYLPPPFDSIINLFLESLFASLLEKALKHAPSMIKKVRDSQRYVKNISGLITHKTHLIGREKEIRAIHSALKREKTSILYFRGDGGVGKTRLLEEVGKKVHRSMSFQSFRWSGIIDLYHADLKDPLHIQNQIIRMIDPEMQFFDKFSSAYQRFKKMKTDGFSPIDLETDRSTLNIIFLDAFNKFSNQHRVVLAFDTLEVLTPVHDEIQNTFNLESTNAILEWLVYFLGHAQNSVFVLASRPSLKIETTLKKIFKERPGCLEIIELEGLTRDDAQKFIANYAKNIDNFKFILENSDHLWELTSGVPVHLCLAIEITAKLNIGIESSQLITHPENFKREIVSRLFEASSAEKIPLYYLVIARKGLSAELLHYLEPSWSYDECVSALTHLRKFSLVKAQPDSSELFLHDVLYELFDQFTMTGPNSEAIYNTITNFYHAIPNKKSLNENNVNCLYYELRQNPLKGFEESYLRWSEEAISGYNAELEMQLRVEVLNFLQSYHFRHLNDQKLSSLIYKEFLFDDAIRWVKRYLAYSQNEKAIELSKALLQLVPPNYNIQSIIKGKHKTLKKSNILKLIHNAPVSFWGQLLTYYGDALNYIGTPAIEVEQVLQTAIQFAKKGIANSATKSWMKSRVLGKAHDRMGYLMRSNGQYEHAIQFYYQAISYYQTAQIYDELAVTLNNLAFVLAFKGQLRQAKHHVEEGLHLHQTIGQKYPLALSYNTKGLIIGLDDPTLGQQECRRALSIFEEIDASRGIGLAYNALAYLLRQQGSRWKSQNISHTKALECYQEALKFLDHSEGIFAKKIQEPIRLWEALNEKGSVFYEIGLLLQRKNLSRAQIYFENSIEFHNQALKVAFDKSLFFQCADTYDDLTQAHLSTNDFEAAEKLIANSINILAELEKPSSANILQKGEDYWLTLAKIHHQKGFLDIYRKNFLSAKKEFSSSFHYFKCFSTSTEYLTKRQNQLFEKLIIQNVVPSMFFSELLEINSI